MAEKKGRIERYGMVWPEGWNYLDVELTAFRYALPEPARFKFKGQILLTNSKMDHFKNIVGQLWPMELGGKRNPKGFEFHPWANRMTEAACAHRYLGIAGCGSSGKSRWAAMWAIVNWLCAPSETLVIVVSTSLKDARERIWGAIEEYWLGCNGRLPGKLVSSQGRVKFEVPGRAVNPDVLCGLTLVAGDKSKAKEAAQNMIGKKASRVILIADEHPELAEAINTAAFSNLSLNPWFQFIGLGNPSSYYDAFGVFIEPKRGWNSIHSEMDEWETTRGMCLRFDGHKSPNWLAGKNIFKYLIKVEDIADARKNMGETSPGYWRMIRGFFCPGGNEQTVFSEADVIKFGGAGAVIWKDEPIHLGALDPAHKTGGDEAIAAFGLYGIEADTEKRVLLLTEEISLREDVTKTDVPMNYQIAQQFRDECRRRGVAPEHAALDGTNIPFADIQSQEWSSKILRVYFGGKATERPLSDYTEEPAHQRCANRVTEIWMAGLELLKNEQLRGMKPALIRQLTSRKVDQKKGVSMQYVVEPKKEMKSRVGFSPDRADAAMILVDLIRERFRGKGALSAKRTKSRTWAGQAMRHDLVSDRSL